MNYRDRQKQQILSKNSSLLHVLFTWWWSCSNNLMTSSYWFSPQWKVVFITWCLFSVLTWTVPLIITIIIIIITACVSISQHNSCFTEDKISRSFLYQWGRWCPWWWKLSSSLSLLILTWNISTWFWLIAAKCCAGADDEAEGVGDTSEQALPSGRSLGCLASSTFIQRDSVEV